MHAPAEKPPSSDTKETQRNSTQNSIQNGTQNGTQNSTSQSAEISNSSTQHEPRTDAEIAAEQLYLERMEEEYAKREGGA
jgi:hypothetical protein